MSEIDPVERMRSLLKAYDDGVLTKDELVIHTFWDQMELAKKWLREGYPIAWCLAGTSSDTRPPVVGTITIGSMMVEIIPHGGT